jgi:hypothetical protein
MTTWVLFLSYCTETQAHETFHRFHARTDCPRDTRLLLFDPRYPMTTVRGKAACAREHGAAYVDVGGNFGQDGNLIFMASYMRRKIAPGDVVVVFDHDHLPRSRSWLKACIDVISAEPHAAYVIPRRDPEWVFENQERHADVAGHRVRKLTWPGGWSMTVMKGDFFNQLPETLRPSHSCYGGTEGNLLQAWTGLGMIGLMMEDYWDDMTDEGVEAGYILWKLEVIAHPGEQLTYDEWLIRHPRETWPSDVKRKESI